jgi:hypothetical protein
MPSNYPADNLGRIVPPNETLHYRVAALELAAAAGPAPPLHALAREPVPDMVGLLRRIAALESRERGTDRELEELAARVKRIEEARIGDDR